MTRLLAVLAIACCSATTRAAPASQPAAERVQGLIEKLAGGTPSQRRQARDELAQIGPDAVPQLQAAAHSAPDPETRSAAEVVLRRIAEHGELGPTLITLHARGTGREIFDAIAKQAGVRFVPRTPQTWPPDQAPTISVDFDRLSFWEAVQRAGEECRVRPTAGADSDSASPLVRGEIQLERIDPKAPPDRVGFASGPFYVYAKAFHTPRATNGWSFRMVALAEPKLRPVFWSIGNVNATDNNGNALRMLNMDAVVPLWGRTPEAAVEFATHPDASRIARLDVNTQILTAVDTQKFEQHDLNKARGTVWLWNGMRIEIESFDLMKDGAYRLMLNLARGGMDEAHFQECYYVVQAVPTQLFDAGGTPLLRDASSMSLLQVNGAPADHIRVLQTFIRDTQKDADPKPGPAFRLLWELPTRLHAYDLPVVLKDVQVR